MGSKPIGLSASRGAAILGLSQWSTPFEVWQKIMEARKPGFNQEKGYTFPVFEGNAATRWGTSFENSIIELAEHVQGLIIGNRERYFQAPNKDFITCHVDGIYSKEYGSEPFKPTLHEGKTTTEWSFRKKWGDPGTDRIPQDYHIQVQHQMLCTGADEVIVSVLVFPKAPQEWEDMGWKIDKHKDSPSGYVVYRLDEECDMVDILDWARTLQQMGFFHQYTIKRNDELIETMVKHYTEFWGENVLGEKPPEPTNMDDFKRMVPNPCGTIIVDSDMELWYNEYKDINQEMKKGGQMDQRKEQLKVLILNRAKELPSTFDESSADKWLFVNEQGKKCGSLSKNKNGVISFR